jgi:hypothetical protein
VLVLHDIIDVADDAEAEAMSLSLNLHRRQLTAKDTRKLIADLIKAAPEKSDRQIAAAAKASPTTVGAVRTKLEPTVQPGQLAKRVGKDGKARKLPARKKQKRDDGSADFTWANDEESRERMAAWTEMFVCNLIALDRQNAHELLNLLWIANKLRARSRLLDRLQKSLERGLPEVHPVVIDQDGNVLAGTQRGAAS